MYEFTILVPVYNEEDNVPRLGEALSGYLPKASRKTSVLFIDDGSSDNSLALLREMCRNNDSFHYISLDRNRGLSAALKAGFDYTKSDLTGYMDADLQTNPVDFEKLLPFIQDYHLVNGVRVDRADSPLKSFLYYCQSHSPGFYPRRDG